MDGQFYLKLFPQHDVDTIARIVDVVRARQVGFVEKWHARYAARFGVHHNYSEQVFREAYLPYLRGAIMRLSEGDAEGFVTSAAHLGEHLARSDVPFAILVAHLQLLKESALELLGDGSGLVAHDVLVTIDKIAACCISAAADSYYRALSGHAPSRPAAHRNSNGEPEGRHSEECGDFHGLVGQSPVMRRLFAQITQVAGSTASVLVCGETGTGKELIARAIHNAGPRRTGPFVAVNCAALPRDLIESELFGYRKGAFSGAVADHIGLFRAATGGTLLLDEITEMRPELQAKLLRVVQEMTVRPVGAVDEVPVDVRLVASTNRDPAQVLADGSFRSDLYYRLSASVINVPPLRERDDDLTHLVAHQLGRLNERYGQPSADPRHLTTAALQRLSDAPWLGNVRELFNVIESAFTACEGGHIGIDDLGLPTAAPAVPSVAGEPIAAQTFEEGERELIERALSTTGGNKQQAARLLGISRKKLYARLAKYALPVVLASPLLIGPLHAASLSRPTVRVRPSVGYPVLFRPRVA